MSTKLAEKQCTACDTGEGLLSRNEIEEMHKQLDPGWQAVNYHHLEREFSFDNYEQSVDFANKVADIAKEQDHHPDILLTYGKVKVTVWSHKAGGLTENDFVFAAKVDEKANA